MASGCATPYRLVTLYVLRLHAGALRLNKCCTNLFVLRTYVYTRLDHARAMPRSPISPSVSLAKVQGNQVDYFLVSCTII